MFCTNCGTRNPAGSKFCGECGTKLELPEKKPLPPEAFFDISPEGQEQCQKILEEALKYNRQGKIDQAIEACHKVLQFNPFSTSAHSLLGSLYEKRGDKEKAIEEYKRVVELNPESLADKAKLEQLMREEPSEGIAERLERPSGLPRILFAFSLCALGFIALVIILWVYFLGAIKGTTEKRGTAAVSVAPRTYTQPQYYPSRQYLQQSVMPKASPVAPTTPSWGYTPSSFYAPQAQIQPSPLEPSAVPRKPAATFGMPRKPKPAKPKPTEEELISKWLESAPEELKTPAKPKTEASKEVASPPPSPEPVELAPPKIFISVAPAKKAREKSEDQISQAKEQERIAMGYQSREDYQRAISEYQKIFNIMPNYPEAGRVHQNIALCYQRLERLSEARAEYRLAIDAYNKQIAANYKPEEARQGISSCEVGLKVCEGK